MGLLDGFFGKRDDKFDWLELDQTTWDEIGTTGDGVEYSIDRSSCYQSEGMVWWKQRAGMKGRLYEYSICAGAIPDGMIYIVIARTLTDPGLKRLKKDTLRQMLRPRTAPLFDKALKQAEVWSGFTGYQTPPPFFLYGLSILAK
jgi:hypothetical protein